MTRIRSLSHVLLAVLVASCAHSGGRPSPSKLLEASTRPQQAQLVRAMNRFALELYPSARGREPNAVFSPASIYWALLLLEPGTRGSSASQLQQGMHLPFTGEALHAEAGEMMQALRTPASHSESTLRVANGLFGREGFSFRKEFLSLLRDRYAAEFTSLDFEEDSAGAREHINRWVAEQTQGRIPEILGEGSPSADAAMLLVNAVYFFAGWSDEFSVGATRPEEFSLLEGGKTTVQMMRSTTWQSYGSSGPVRVLEMGYTGSPVVFDILLPKDVDGLPEVEAQLTPERLDEWLGGLESTRVDLSLPRFRVTSEIASLKGSLQTLGLRDVFRPLVADLSGMGGRRGEIFVSDVVHKAFLEINEKGTEAAAVTAVQTTIVSLGPPPPEPIEFRVDRPFLFLLRDSRTQQILFMGRVTRPEAPPAPPSDY
ncbi:serpin family protein [Hyalangium gracile]|uniref:serpin family protein n=1 Tax=Hyalangium gracile TaxID=394092 RepID=UPI001CCF1356|nr:serpin family protein [Hyalangium gracile]